MDGVNKNVKDQRSWWHSVHPEGYSQCGLYRSPLLRLGRADWLRGESLWFHWRRKLLADISTPWQSSTCKAKIFACIINHLPGQRDIRSYLQRKMQEKFIMEETKWRRYQPSIAVVRTAVQILYCCFCIFKRLCHLVIFCGSCFLKNMCLLVLFYGLPPCLWHRT